MLRLVSPGAGTVAVDDVPVLGVTGGPSPLDWSLEYAPIELVDPYALAEDDPDYIGLGSGTGFLHSELMGVFPAAALADGIYFLLARARPSGGGLEVLTGQVIAKGVDEGSLRPVIALRDPPGGSRVTLTRKILGSIQSERPLREWHADYAPAEAVDLNNLGSEAPGWVRFASGTATVADGAIGVFDATRVPNGSYLIRVVAWNDLGLGRVEPLAVEVTGEAKLGRLRREFTDLKVELAGFPLEVRRIYNSFKAGQSGAFGHGWSLGLADADIGETVPDTGANLFGATPFRHGTRVYLTTPEGPRAGFTFRPELAASSFLGAIYRASFEPDPGVTERLEVPEGSQPFLTIDSAGAARLFLLGLPWNPDRYVVTTPDQRRYTYHEHDGLHVATALPLGAIEFLTFERRQKHLAEVEGLHLPLVEAADDRVFVQERHERLAGGTGAGAQEALEVLQAQWGVRSGGESLGARGIDAGRSVGAGQGAQSHDRTQRLGTAFFH